MRPPESPPATERLIAAFAGAVKVGVGSPAVNCRLSGAEQGTGIALEVHFSGAEAQAPLGSLQDVQVYEQGHGAERHWLLRSGRAQHVLQARSAQVHRMPAAAFYAAVQPSHLTFATRLGWVLLLNLLRIPGAARLVAWLRSPRQ
jgi:hypothetical protein